MINPYRILTSIAGLLMLSLAISGCHRASYVFQPGSGRPPAAEYTARLADTSALGLAPAVAQVPSFAVPSHSLPLAKKNRAHRSRTPAVAVAMRMPTLLRPAVQLHKRLVPGAARPNGPTPPERYRSRGIALLLALVPFFFGIFGLHRFYLGYVGHGIAYLLGGLLAGFLLLLGALGLLFGGTGFAGLFAVGTIIAVVLFGLQLSDVVRIITGSLEPKNGEYNPGFFQPSRKVQVPAPAPEQK